MRPILLNDAIDLLPHFAESIAYRFRAAKDKIAFREATCNLGSG